MSGSSKWSYKGHGTSGVVQRSMDDRGRNGYTREHRDAQLGIVREHDTECVAGSKCIAVAKKTCVHACVLRALIIENKQTVGGT